MLIHWGNSKMQCMFEGWLYNNTNSLVENVLNCDGCCIYVSPFSLFEFECLLCVIWATRTHRVRLIHSDWSTCAYCVRLNYSYRCTYLDRLNYPYILSQIQLPRFTLAYFTKSPVSLLICLISITRVIKILGRSNYQGITGAMHG